MKRFICSTLICAVYLSIASSCAMVQPTQNEVDIQNPQSTLLPLLVQQSELIELNCTWSFSQIFQSQHLSEDDNKGSIDIAIHTLDGICPSLDIDNTHIRLRHELYAYKNASPEDTSVFIPSLASNEKWHELSSENQSKVSTAKCATYANIDYQDCFWVSTHDNIISVIWTNSAKGSPDSFLLKIANSINANFEYKRQQ